MAEGKVVSCSAQVATAEGRIVDVKGDVYATGTATCLYSIFPAAERSIGVGARVNLTTRDVGD